MTSIGTFPFGQPVLPLVQQDRRPQKVFVLGVYASAVHARWRGPDGAEIVKALGHRTGKFGERASRQRRRGHPCSKRETRAS